MKTHVTYSQPLSRLLPFLEKNQPKTNLEHLPQNNKLSAVYSAGIYKTAE